MYQVPAASVTQLTHNSSLLKLTTSCFLIVLLETLLLMRFEGTDFGEPVQVLGLQIQTTSTTEL
jgi:hypothetical protein